MPNKVPFKVVQLSGEDETFKGTELNIHSPSSRGWQSNRCCSYPQNIIIQLEFRTRMKKIQILSHQHLIATKIEFYVGDVPNGHPVSPQNARYIRLGYVALSDNKRTSFKARELKSVHVDAVGHFVKFVIHKNFLNSLNPYNQVGLIAINVIGDDVRYAQDMRGDVQVGDSISTEDRPDFISQFDDLAFDIYQDPEVAQIIRRLDAKKYEAGTREQFDFAKSLKEIIHQLTKVGEKLGKYELEKRQAVENEDYDKAHVKKVQMEEFRSQMYRQLQLEDLIELPKHIPAEIETVRVRTPSPPRRVEEIHEKDRSTSVTAAVQPSPVVHPRRVTPHNAYDERPLPALKNKMENIAEDRQQQDDVAQNADAEPEPMSENDLREAGSMPDVFGLRLTSKAFSKHWNFREEALNDIYDQMVSFDPHRNDNDAKALMRAALIAISKAVKDNVFSVFVSALNLHRMILLEFVPRHRIMKAETSYFIERSIPSLILKTGDVAVRQRDAAKSLIIEESSFPEVKSVGSLMLECLKPFKHSTLPRLALSRTEIVDSMYQVHGLSPGSGGLNLESMMTFLVEALFHTSGEVRDRAAKVVLSLYGRHGAVVKNHLQLDDDRTKTNPMFKHLLKEFEKIDANLSPEDVRRQKQETEHCLKDVPNSKMVRDDGRIPKISKEKKEKVTYDRPAKETSDSNKKRSGNNSVIRNASEFNEAQLNKDCKCVFCGEYNVNFTEKVLDLHYWKHCPMLTRCLMCKQVVEICELNNHLLEECTSQTEFSRCQTCGQAVLRKELSRHSTQRSCVPAAGASEVLCPLCHLKIPTGEESWRRHLMARNGCSQNQRRISGKTVETPSPKTHAAISRGKMK